jgi:hypothetical protein
MLIANWRDKEFLVFERDLFDVPVIAEERENIIAMAVRGTSAS